MYDEPRTARPGGRGHAKQYYYGQLIRETGPVATVQRQVTVNFPPVLVILSSGSQCRPISLYNLVQANRFEG